MVSGRKIWETAVKYGFAPTVELGSSFSYEIAMHLDRQVTAPDLFHSVGSSEEYETSDEKDTSLHRYSFWCSF